MKTDTIFYSLFQAFPSIFFELINQSPEEAVTYEFTSREIKQLAFRLDGLFLPTTNDSEKPFYVVEVQFQPDGDLYYRLFGELFLYLKQYKPLHPWHVVVIYPTRSIEREQTLHFGEILALNRVNSQRSLFSPQDLADLERLIVPLPDEIEELSKAIASWCNQEEHASHLNALRQVRQILSNSALERVSETNTDTKTPDNLLNKQTLLNSIKQSSSSN